MDFIRDADEHWERILWELESSERAIDATEDLFRYKDGKPVLPKGRERMFRSYEKTDGQSFINTFSPEVRDTAYFHAFNQILRRIENTAQVIVDTADCAIGIDAAQLVLMGLKGFRDDYEEHILHHRCLGSLKNPVPCVALCPAGVDIPGYIALIRAGRYTLSLIHISEPTRPY